MARKADIDDLGAAIKPNGDGRPMAEPEPAPMFAPIASAFPPIADYAFLSDCEVNALIAPSGRVEWMCLPRPDSTSVFAAMLDRAAGSFGLSLDCDPVFDYGHTAAQWEYAGPGYGEAVAKGGDGDIPLRLVTDLRVGFEGPGAHATKTLRQGEKAYAALAWPRSQYSASSEFWAEHPPPSDADEAFARIERTADFWREWINRGEFPEHPWQSYLQRSALTLKGLTYSPTGALLAAPTTSLPESIGGERNWDY